ncbi:arabinofuranosyltransferase [Dactylosporangium sp. NPDC048998]|uniref:arabinofuranosyltransferase n=1 Tax=Dactylosporangium sp. NPDC048998 TaxID=3363976 RepID=UPI003715E446
MVVLHEWGVRAGLNPHSPRVEYGLHFASLTLAALAAAVVWWSRRRASTWDADLLPALIGGLGALTLLTVLHGTPFGVQGISGDQAFRAAQITRFADSWHGADYTYRGLPTYYAPAYFWVLGRAADIASVEPWHMLKYGTIVVAFVAPIVSYLMWRRVVPTRTAALISAASIVVPVLNEPYAWLAEAVIVPWWLLAIFGVSRPARRSPNLIVLGLVGAVLFLTYYYYFFLLVIMYGLFLAVQWRLGQLDWRQVRRSVAILAISAVGSSPYWAPLGWNFLTAPQFESLNNRWMTSHSGDLGLPMLQLSVVGVLCMVGLLYLIWTVKEALSRALLIILVSAYLWHGLGFVLAAVDSPIMSFRMRSIVTLVLLAAATLALIRITKLAATKLPAIEVRRVAAAGGIVLAVFAADRYVTATVADTWVQAAHDGTLPSGQLPAYHSSKAKAQLPSAQEVDEFIAANYKGAGHPVVLSDRSDLFAFYPYYGFVQFNANYSHPTARYHDRLDFLDNAAQASTAQDFATQMRHNQFDTVDVLVLRTNGKSLTFRSSDDAFPFGNKARVITIPAHLVHPDHFSITTLNGYVIAVLR